MCADDYLYLNKSGLNLLGNINDTIILWYRGMSSNYKVTPTAGEEDKKVYYVRFGAMFVISF